MLLLLQWMLDRGERSSCSGCDSSLRRNPLAGACQKALCLGNGAPDDVFGRGDVLNEGDGFSAHLVLSFVWCGPTTGILQAFSIGPMSSAIDLVSCVSSLRGGRSQRTPGSVRGARSNPRPLYVADCLANRQIC